MTVRYSVVKTYKSSSTDPFQLKAGAEVGCVDESDPNGDWPNWILCRDGNSEGWVPKQIIRREGQSGIIAEDYNAAEFDLEPGEILVGIKELNGWIWSYKEDRRDIKAWAPLNCLEIIK